MRSNHVFAIILAAGTLTGCARMTPGLGFEQVSGDVEARTGATTRWNRGAAEDAAVRDAWRALLSRGLTADAAVQVALLNNRDLQATYEELDISQADLVRAGLLRNPVFSGELRFDTDGGGTGIGLDVAQEFLSLFTLPLRRASAGAAFEVAKARVTRAAVDAAFEARAAFYEYQAAEEIRALRAEIVEATGASAELAQRLHEAGNTPDLNMLSEQALHEQAKLDLAAAASNAAQARERLNQAMGLWGSDTGWTAAARLPTLPEADETMEAIERQAVAQSLELAEARAQVDQAAIGARLARPLAWLGEGEAGAVAERETEGGWSVGPSLSIPIPVFDQGGAATGESAARLRQASHRYYAAAVRVRASARAAAAAMESARLRVLQHTTVLLPLHARLIASAQLQYNAMQISPLQLLQAKRDQIAAGVSSIQALRDYWTARAGVQRALSGGAAAIPAAIPTPETSSTGASGAGGH